MSVQDAEILEHAPVYVRVHARTDNKSSRNERNTPRKWARYALVLDTETTTDTKQSLLFGFYRFCALQQDGSYVCQEEGVLYADELDKRSVTQLRRYAQSARAETMEGCPKRLRFSSRSEFVEEVFWRACQAGAVVVGCNLPFDLSRLAVEYRGARRRNTGWSLILFRYYNQKKRKWLPNSYRPRVKISPKDSRDAFIRLAGGGRRFKRGRFLNLPTLAWALRNRRYGLDSGCQEWQVPGKLDHKPAGKVTAAEIAYCRQDVRSTTGWLNALKAEYDKYPVDLQPEKVHSPASIAKAYLDTMGLKRPSQKYSLPDKVHGIAMQGYYGGRSEVRIRHTIVPVVYCDFTSEYPTVNSLLSIWPQLKDLKVRNATRGVQNLLRSIALEQLFDPNVWPRFAFFALVKPDGDILPVRTRYSDTSETNIGLNPLTSKQPIWYAGPDLVASTLLTGQAPRIMKAIKLVPAGVQRGLASTLLGDRNIRPRRDDFFRAVIENRKQLPAEHPMHYFLKILANAAGTACMRS